MEQKPERVFSAGQIHASVFYNERIVEGIGRDIPSVSFQKRYQENGQWKSTTSLNTNDLPKAILALSKAYDYLVSKTKVLEEDEA